MRLIGIDFGGARIGVAACDLNGLPTPRPMLAASGTLKSDAEAIMMLARKEEADRVVLGLPLKEGKEERMARVVRQLGALLEGLGCAVEYADETLTSAEGQAAMLSAGLKGSQVKARLDSESACRILARYQEEHGQGH